MALLYLLGNSRRRLFLSSISPQQTLGCRRHTKRLDAACCCLQLLVFFQLSSSSSLMARIRIAPKQSNSSPSRMVARKKLAKSQNGAGVTALSDFLATSRKSGESLPLLAAGGAEKKQQLGDSTHHPAASSSAAIGPPSKSVEVDDNNQEKKESLMQIANEKTTSIQQTASVDLPIFNLNELKLVFGGEDNFNEIKTLLPKSTDLPFSIFAATLDLIDTESSRLKKISILSNFFYSILNSNPNLLVKIIFMMLNRVAEPYENIEFGIGQQLVTKCISQMTGMNSKELQKKLVTYGDLGLLLEAQQMVQKPLIKPKPLLIGKTFNSLLDMARISGDKSKQIKITKLQEILTAAKCTETRYIVRFILLQMRIGVGEKNILAALGRAFAALKYPQIFAASLDEPKSTEQIEVKDLFNECVRNFIIAYNQCPNYSLIIERLHNWQDQALRPKSTNKRSNCGIDCFSNFAENFTLSIGIPVMPMLAHPCKDFESVLTRFKDRSFIGEYKYDGERAQIHYSNSPSNHVEIFSRNCENSTAKFPDIKSSIISLVETFNVAIEKKTDKSTEKILNFIIDCEIVAYSSENQTILPFQILSTRKRKDVEVADIKVQVALIIFDIILFNNKSLVKETLPRRKKLIAKLLESYPKTDVSPPDESDNINQHVILQSEWRHIKSSEALQNFFEESINNSCEGLMLKTFDDDSSSNYEISSRSRCWLKLKKDYLEGSGDSLDLVPIGAYMGEGKRKGVYGAYLLATYDSNTQNYIAIARCGSGFSEECLKDLYEEINCESSNLKHYSDSKPAAYIVPKHLFPDVWLCASKVFEIRAADLTLSPLYQVAFGSIEESKGISLRFPRFLNQRSDKSPQQSTSPSEILELYKNQKSISGHDSNERKGGNNPKYSKLEIEDMNESDTESEEDDEDDDPYN